MTPRSPDAAAVQQGASKGKVTTITLVTGDRVRLVKGPKGYAAIAAPGPGRDGVVFGTQRRGDKLWVFPSDAVSLIANGRLDRRLFEVTELAKAGYADNKRTTIPLIIQHGKGKPVGTLPKGAAKGRELASVGSTVVQQKKQSAATFWKWLTGSTKAVPGKKQTIGGAYTSSVRKVWLDGRMTASLDRSVPQVGAPAAWAKGYTGKNVKVAVLDTGIDTNHLDLKGAVTASKDFSGSGSVLDKFGHGTHVASIITGDGARSGGKYKGVAPDATLLNGKVLDDGGSGTESTVIAGMEWAVQQQAKIINMSLGGGVTDGTDIVDVALNELSSSSGALFVVAAGNLGPERYTVTTPSSANEALAVAATNRNQTTADFSSAGPRVGDYAVKPEIAAPGRDIVAARAAGTELGPIVGTYYTALSGTSMATPHVAGAAALLSQQVPTWNARLLKSALMGTAKLPVNESVFHQGAGFLDASRAVTQKVFALEGSVSANLQWPHTQKTEKTITYRNPNATPLTLNLGFRPVDQNGNVAPAGVFSLPSSVTIPARTTAKVTLTIDPAKASPGLLYQGRINATATGIVVRTPVTANIEREAYDVTLDITDRNGDKVDSLNEGQLLDVPYVINAATGTSAVVARLKDGKWVARAPRGAYALELQVLTTNPDTGAVSQTMFAVPRFTATAPVTLNLDARQGKLVTAKVNGANPVTQTMGTAIQEDIKGNLWGTGVTVTDLTAAPEAYAVGVASFGRPAEFSMFQEINTGSGIYAIPYTQAGSIPDGLEHAVSDSQLAEVKLTIGAHNAWATGDFLRDVAFGTGDFLVGFGSHRVVRTPTEFTFRQLPVLDGKPTEWFSTLWANQPNGEWAYDELKVEQPYEAGKQYAVNLSTGAWSPQGTGSVWSDGFAELAFGPFNASGSDVIFPYPFESFTGDWVVKRGTTTVATSSDPFGAWIDSTVRGATYTAVMHAQKQSPWSPFVPKVSGTWTFKVPPASGTEEVVPMPVVSTAVTGAFDKWGRAPAGRAFPLTLNVKGADGGVASATVRVSNDDGRTWTTVPVSNASGQWVATVTHPATFTNPYMSLRVIVTDTKGNSGGWTATRAYKIANLG